MTDLRRTIKCSSCGFEASVTISSELDMKELILSGKCSRCGSAMQINYSIVDANASPQSSSSSSSSSSEQAPLINIDESLFTPEIPSDAIRDLMED
jgi:CRISPR/Cas system-associated protein Cas10 (large subunit of type III CRISPR-Cas system)